MKKCLPDYSFLPANYLKKGFLDLGNFRILMIFGF